MALKACTVSVPMRYFEDDKSRKNLFNPKTMTEQQKKEEQPLFGTGFEKS